MRHQGISTFRETPRFENHATVSLGPCVRKNKPRSSLWPRGYCPANGCHEFQTLMVSFQ
jgi:hypothetical protein